MFIGKEQALAFGDNNVHKGRNNNVHKKWNRIVYKE